MRPPRRAHFEMVLPRDIRQRMLRYDWDVSQTQIANAVRANIKIKNQRRQTVTNLDKHSKVEEMLENAGRSFVRKILFKKSTRKEMEELDKKMEEVKKIRAQHQMERMEVSDSDLDLESHSGDHTDSESGDGKLDFGKVETLPSSAINISSR
jgi:TPP-dependent indolepyruvate ferredoxin oxidoreductase alpha subunit